MTLNNKKKRHIYVFGEEIGEKIDEEGKDEPTTMHQAIYHHRYTREHRGGSIWGCLLLFAGLILVLNNFGIIAWTFWYAIAPLWPLLLVLFGLRIIFGRSTVARIIVLLLTCIFIMMTIIYGLLRINAPLSKQIPTGMRNSVETVRIFYQ